MAAAALSALLTAVWGPSQVISYAIAYFCALYALSVWTPSRRFAWGAALVTVVDIASSAGPGEDLRGAVPFAVVTLVVMVLVRRVVGDRERRLRLAERERDVAAREAIVEERARIARELHDVIAHHVSMIVMQAGAERRVLEGAEGGTGGVLATIEEIGRGAMVEMRRLLGMLRDGHAEPLAPQPGLDDLPSAIQQLCDAGLPVELLVEGERRVLPVGLELSAYRIVQEALTNALKHAGDARATVHVRYRADSLELEITDDGSDQVAQQPGGHGLVGMRERVALCGGQLHAGNASAVNTLSAPAATPMTRVLIVDDQALARVGLRKILEGETDTEVVGEAIDGQLALVAARRLRPDVVLMDIRMPGLDGIESTRRIVRRPARHARSGAYPPPSGLTSTSSRPSAPARAASCWKTPRRRRSSPRCA